MGVLNNNNSQLLYGLTGTLDIRGLGAVQKNSSSKAATIFARRAHFQYVSTEK
jgi:hypothetical protein